MTLTSSIKRMTVLAAAAAGALWFGAPTAAEAQYYGGPAYGYAYGQQPYVSPRILRKQREMQRRVMRKYGYAPPAYGYRGPVFRQDPAYSYGAPVYRQPQVYRQPRVYQQPQVYRQAPVQNYGAPAYRQPRGYGYAPSPTPQYNGDGLTLQDRIGSAR